MNPPTSERQSIRLKINLIGEERFTIYNKISILHRTFPLVNLDYQLVVVSDLDRSKFRLPPNEFVSLKELVLLVGKILGEKYPSSVVLSPIVREKSWFLGKANNCLAGRLPFRSRMDWNILYSAQAENNSQLADSPR